MPDHNATTMLPADRSKATMPLPTSWGELQIVRRFRAMNTHIDLYAMRPDIAPLLAEAEQIFHDVESRFTRFAPAQRTLSLQRAHNRQLRRLARIPRSLAPRDSDASPNAWRLRVCDPRRSRRCRIRSLLRRNRARWRVAGAPIHPAENIRIGHRDRRWQCGRTRRSDDRPRRHREGLCGRLRPVAPA